MFPYWLPKAPTVLCWLLPLTCSGCLLCNKGPNISSHLGSNCRSSAGFLTEGQYWEGSGCYEVIPLYSFTNGVCLYITMSNFPNSFSTFSLASVLSPCSQLSPIHHLSPLLFSLVHVHTWADWWIDCFYWNPKILFRGQDLVSFIRHPQVLRW